MMLREGKREREALIYPSVLVNPIAGLSFCLSVC